MPLPSLYSPADAETMRARVAGLKPDAQAQWGKMQVAQMLAHCQVPLQTALGEVTMKRTLIGRLFGGLAKKSLVSEKPFGKGLPTDPRFRVKDPRDFGTERARLLGLFDRFVAGEDQADGFARGREGRIVKPPLAKLGRVARCRQQHVALAQRNAKLLGELQQHLAAGLRASGFQEAQVPRGDFGLAGEIELAHAAALAPVAQKIADGL